MRGRGGRLPDLFDAVLSDAVLGVVLGGIEMPGMNCALTGWVQIRRRGFLGRTLIWDRYQLLHALWEFEQLYNFRRPHRGVGRTCSLHPLPAPITVAGADRLPCDAATGAVRRHPR